MTYITALKKAVKDIAKRKTNHGWAKKYDQGEWCGSECCIVGHVAAIKGFRMDYSISDVFDGIRHEVAKKNGDLVASKLTRLFFKCRKDTFKRIEKIVNSL